MKREIPEFDKKITEQKNLLAADHSELDAMLGGLIAAFEEDTAGRIYQKLDFFLK